MYCTQLPDSSHFGSLESERARRDLKIHNKAAEITWLLECSFHTKERHKDQDQLVPAEGFKVFEIKIKTINE